MDPGDSRLHLLHDLGIRLRPGPESPRICPVHTGFYENSALRAREMFKNGHFARFAPSAEALPAGTGLMFIKEN